MYLLDTNIVSADAPAKRQVGPEAFATWVREHDDLLYISTVTIAEIEAGIARADRIGASTKAERLRRWLAAVEHFYAGRILPFDVDAARHAGAIFDRARAHDPGFQDIAIAATAAARGFTVLTANERHFTSLGVPLANPLKQLPSARA
ncbi:VapC toxin family PIN domain ribonuclease [Rhodoplanes elegans]|uniref:Ribonuclease VapC n=1 Tax=Rhodoplanes elegans TaxID=29408 RepID=A0A327KVD4_9BRAD|nr:PIN domain-containing protein [Rhodoplanes elegans]MBK5960180.1 VapC toxin family PIN domain ribonuclease [Rhodoplanes elegans]RAI42241.1 VapC toxin family PIN domain ribonuclease [Rhodoplanes elegans]